MTDHTMVRLTPAAARRIIQSAMDGKMEGLALRLSAMRNADDQFHYGMGFDDQERENDVKFESEGVKIVVAAASLPLVKDMTIDYVELEKNSYHFIFLNPNDPGYVPPRE